jgi:hypothetical protein
METGWLDKVRATVVTLNNLYGYGDVKQIRLYAGTKVEFLVQGFGMNPQWRCGRLIGETVYALNHQRKLAA